METVRSVDDLRVRVRDWRRRSLSIGLVPTMGALHDGHMALVARSLEASTRTVATLFINPRQFGRGEDLESYPRDEANDAKILTRAGVDLLFAPTAGEMYPPGFATAVGAGEIGDILEGSHRPGFFDGVATVVAKLLIQAVADRAYFGEKDYQQLLVIRRMALDLDIPTAIEGVATVRQEDGLALSSRNAYLSAEQRLIAPLLYKTICDAGAQVIAGAEIPVVESRGREKLLSAGFDGVDYLSVRDAENLRPYAGPDRPGRVLAAARLGRARLIDNVAV